MCTALQQGGDVEQPWLMSKYDVILLKPVLRIFILFILVNASNIFIVISNVFTAMVCMTDGDREIPEMPVILGFIVQTTKLYLHFM